MFDATILYICPINVYRNDKRTSLNCIISDWSHPLADQFIIDGKLKSYQKWDDSKTFHGPLIETFFTHTRKNTTTTLCVVSLVTQEEYVLLNEEIKNLRERLWLDIFTKEILSYLSADESNPFKAGITYFHELDYSDQLENIFPNYDTDRITTNYSVGFNFHGWDNFFSSPQPEWGSEFCLIHRNGKFDGRYGICHDELLLENTEIDFNSFYELEDSEKYERIHHELKYDAKNKSLQMLKEIYANYISENIED